MEPPEKVMELLPSTTAKWILWLSLFLSGLLYALLQYLQVDTLLPLAQAQKLSILLPSAALLLIGAYLSLIFVVRSFNEQKNKHEEEIFELKNKKSKVGIDISKMKRFQSDQGPFEPEAFHDS